MALAKLLTIGVGIFALYIAIQFRAILDDAPVPVLERDRYWGAGEYRLDSSEIKGFKIQVADHVSGFVFILNAWADTQEWFVVLLSV